MVMGSAQPGFSAADAALKLIEDNGGYARLARSEIIANYLGSTCAPRVVSSSRNRAKPDFFGEDGLNKNKKRKGLDNDV